MYGGGGGVGQNLTSFYKKCRGGGGGFGEKGYKKRIFDQSPKFFI
jgi:hypothetical protein